MKRMACANTDVYYAPSGVKVLFKKYVNDDSLNMSVYEVIDLKDKTNVFRSWNRTTEGAFKNCYQLLSKLHIDSVIIARWTRPLIEAKGEERECNPSFNIYRISTGEIFRSDNSHILDAYHKYVKGKWMEYYIILYE